MIPDPSSPIPRYAVSEIDGMLLPRPQPDGGWVTYRDHAARLAQLAQEQATLQANLDSLYGAKFSDRVYVALKARAETAEAALGETRQALHQLIEKLAVVLPIVDGYIAITHIRSGGQYTGPNLIEEMKHAKALLSRVAQTGVPREDSVPQGRSRGDTTDSAEGA